MPGRPSRESARPAWLAAQEPRRCYASCIDRDGARDDRKRCLEIGLSLQHPACTEKQEEQRCAEGQQARQGSKEKRLGEIGHVGGLGTLDDPAARGGRRGPQGKKGFGHAIGSRCGKVPVLGPKADGNDIRAAGPRNGKPSCERLLHALLGAQAERVAPDAEGRHHIADQARSLEDAVELGTGFEPKLPGDGPDEVRRSQDLQLARGRLPGSLTADGNACLRMEAWRDLQAGKIAEAGNQQRTAERLEHNTPYPARQRRGGKHFGFDLAGIGHC